MRAPSSWALPTYIGPRFAPRSGHGVAPFSGATMVDRGKHSLGCCNFLSAAAVGRYQGEWGYIQATGGLAEVATGGVRAESCRRSSGRCDLFSGPVAHPNSGVAILRRPAHEVSYELAPHFSSYATWDFSCNSFCVYRERPMLSMTPHRGAVSLSRASASFQRQTRTSSNERIC